MYLRDNIWIYKQQLYFYFQKNIHNFFYRGIQEYFELFNNCKNK